MLDIVKFEGVKAKVHRPIFKFFTAAVLAVATFIMIGCNDSAGSANSGNPTGVDPNETAATVNGKPIKLEEVERVIKQQGKGQENKLSDLELANARLQVLESLIQNEVLFQKAEKEGTVPADEEVTAEINKQKTGSGVSQEEFDKRMNEAGFTADTLRENVKKGLSAKKLIEKVTGKIENPKDSEIDAFYNGNKSAFVKKRGVKLAAIVIDPTDSGEGDMTRNETDATLKIKEIQQQLQQSNGANFSQVASEKSEDPSRLQGGELGYFSEEDLNKNFPQLAAGFMDAKFGVGSVTPPLNLAGKIYIFKLQERIEKEENLTLETPGVRQQIIESLINARKQLLSASYAAIAMNEAKIENFLAKKVVDNPNELSGARPASPETPNSNTNSNSKSNANSNANGEANKTSSENTKKVDNKNTNTATNAAK